MKPTHLAAVAATAAAAALGAHAAGSRSDASAVAAGASSAASATTAAPVAAGAGPATSSLADRLGVGEARLRAALHGLRDEQRPGDGHFAGAPATALDTTEANVAAALEKVRQSGSDGRRARPDRLAPALATELGVSAERVRTALREAMEARHAARMRQTADALAEELGIEAGRVAAALERLRDSAGERRGPSGDMTEDLARALGLEEERVDEAFDALREARAAEHEQRRAERAGRLAAALGISAERVREALADRPGLGRGGRGHGLGRP